MRVVQGRDFPLHDAQVGAAQHADFAIGPGLARDPVKRVAAIGGLLFERPEDALGCVAPAHILDHHGIAALDERRVIGRDGGPLAVGRAHQDGGIAAGRLRPEDICGETHTVPHGHGNVEGGRGLVRCRGQRPGAQQHYWRKAHNVSQYCWAI